ncbi:MAG: sulfatase-like hydrolase/transferase, partial [Polyangiaceae bacterium]
MRYVDALLCVAALLIGEWLAVGLLSWGEIAGPIELLVTLASLVPFALLLAVPVSVGGALLVFALERPEEPRARVLAAVPAVVLAAVVAVAVSGGRQLAGARGPIFVAVTVVFAGGITWLVAPWVGRGLRWLHERGWWWVVAAALGAVIAVEVANRVVLPRLYLAFHVGLAVLATWLAAVASLAWSVNARRRLRLGLCAGVVLLSAVLAPGAPERLRLFDNIRVIYVERAPILSHPLRLMGLLSPPPPIVDPGEAPKGEGPELVVDLTGRDIVLVTIDALRADHVGAYGYERATTPALDALAETGV